jgi:uroporphyrinogen III methyltransferase/synthase
MAPEVQDRPLSGRRIIVTRPRHQAAEFIDRLTAAGADVLPCASIEIVPPQSWDSLDDALRRLEQFDWVVFTSVNGVDVFFERMRALGRSSETLRHARLATVGPKTARALEREGVRVEVIPEEFRAEAVADAMRSKGISGSRILLPRAAAAREVLAVMLREAGARVEEIASYDTVRAQTDSSQARQLLSDGKVDLVTFTSSSTVSNFVDLLGDEAVSLLQRSRIGCIGPITADTVRTLGLDVDIQPSQYTIAAFTEAIIEYFTGIAPSSQGE